MSVGAKWEQALGRWHVYYRQQGLAWVAKTSPPTIKRDGRLQYAGTAPPDYLGVLAGGRSVAFEAKATAGESYDTSQVKKHQRRDLDMHLEHGGCTFVALYSSVHQVGWVVPWAWLRTVKGTIHLSKVAAQCQTIPARGWIEVLP